MSVEFLLLSLLVVLIPGTGVIYTVSTGLLSGWRASVAAACGCTLGIIPHLLASILGLATLLHMSALAFQAVKYAGAAYLLWLAWNLWRETGAMNIDTPKHVHGFRRIALRGILLNILNPKLSIFFLAFLPQFLSTEASSPLGHLLLLSGVFMLMTLMVFIGYGCCAHWVRNYLSHSPRIMNRIQRSFAMLFAALGIKLALSEPS